MTQLLKDGPNEWQAKINEMENRISARWMEIGAADCNTDGELAAVAKMEEELEVYVSAVETALRNERIAARGLVPQSSRELAAKLATRRSRQNNAPF